MPGVTPKLHSRPRPSCGELAEPRLRFGELFQGGFYGPLLKPTASTDGPPFDVSWEEPLFKMTSHTLSGIRTIDF